MTSSACAPPDRVLITGASGLIGSVASEMLAHHGFAITALGLQGPFPPAADCVFTGDVADVGLLTDALADASAVVHLAALRSPRLGSPFEVFRSNSLATFGVLAAAADVGVRRVVLASSINANGLFFNPAKPMPAYFPIDEEMPADLADAYSFSKNVDEQSAKLAYTMWGMDVVALRFPLVAIEEHLRDRSRQYRADPAMAVREGWSYLDLRDAAQAILCALKASLTGTHILSLSAPDTLMTEPTESLLQQHAPGVPLRRPIPERSSAVDASRAAALLHFSARYSIYD